ncbi:MAG: chaperone modulator CbpM [Saprospiraceae bacterium]|nr:chaperone modulator CbpM [Candidatus Vicinibacter proximus]MBL7823140.1 chaperone modulator CbpM [Saprospiraceae bacterium]MCC6842531.1 chaperone modulator CbpM [Saprospiraceae bacterium]HRG32111.1 chaperone modulator CbpM [Saprospiraceae bacterium]
MENNQLVLIDQVCVHYEVELNFIDSLEEYGLIQLVVMDNTKYLSPDDLQYVEKMIRLKYELGINMEGIDVINNLLHQIDNLQNELVLAKKKLSIYEQDEYDLKS